MERKLRIVYLGTPDFAVLPLKRLVEAGYDVVGVVTNPDKPAGRGRHIQKSAVKVYADEAGLPVLQPEKFKDEAFLADLAALKADLQVVVAFKMLPEVVWNMPRYGTINLHASLLPDYRGAAPINWAIINGDKKTGVSTFLLQHEIDTGKILGSREVEIPEDMTAGELHDKLMVTGADLLLESVDAINSGNYELHPQEELIGKSAFRPAPKIFKADMKIDWGQDMDVIYNFIRGLSPYPAAWFNFVHEETGETLAAKLFKVKKLTIQHEKNAGTLWKNGKNSFGVYVKGGVIEFLELQVAGKKRMDAVDFLRGFDPEHFRIQ